MFFLSSLLQLLPLSFLCFYWFVSLVWIVWGFSIVITIGLQVDFFFSFPDGWWMLFDYIYTTSYLLHIFMMMALSSFNFFFIAFHYGLSKTQQQSTFSIPKYYSWVTDSPLNACDVRDLWLVGLFWHLVQQGDPCFGAPEGGECEGQIRLMWHTLHVMMRLPCCC